ncbi:MAG: type II toxin-antitoxin system RelE/ParE family toxin [Chlamydiota bacterium]
MTYKIEFTKAAEKSLADIPRADLKKLAKKIDKLASNPFPEGSEKLKGCDNLFRIRQGDYRILYSVCSGKLLVLIVKIGHRREVYR